MRLKPPRQYAVKGGATAGVLSPPPRKARTLVPLIILDLKDDSCKQSLLDFARITQPLPPRRAHIHTHTQPQPRNLTSKDRAKSV